MEPNLLFSAEQIDRRVTELATDLEKRFTRDEIPHLVGVLKGSFVFLADLIRAGSTPVTVDFVRIESYGSQTTSSCTPKLTDPIKKNLHNRDVVIVEDIVDTGQTLKALRQHILRQQPRNLYTVALLNKTASRQVDVRVDLYGFDGTNQFVVGYGLDHNERYRQLPYLASIPSS